MKYFICVFRGMIKIILIMSLYFASPYILAMDKEPGNDSIVSRILEQFKKPTPIPVSHLALTDAGDIVLIDADKIGFNDIGDITLGEGEKRELICQINLHDHKDLRPYFAELSSANISYPESECKEDEFLELFFALLDEGYIQRQFAEIAMPMKIGRTITGAVPSLFGGCMVGDSIDYMNNAPHRYAFNDGSGGPQIIGGLALILLGVFIVPRTAYWNTSVVGAGVGGGFLCGYLGGD